MQTFIKANAVLPLVMEDQWCLWLLCHAAKRRV